MSSPSLIPANPELAQPAATLIHASSHELLDFMFGSPARAESILASLFKKNQGHFSHQFATATLLDGNLLGLELGYSTTALKKTEPAGNLFLLLSSPVALWPHIIFKVGSIVSSYVPPPSENVYYINNLAVLETARGAGLGRRLIQSAAKRAKQQNLTALELDVTADNAKAIGFYKKLGFIEKSRSGSNHLLEKHSLPHLIRLQLPL